MSWLPEWLKEVSVYFWLIGVSLAMFVLTQDSDPTYLDLWLVTLLYGLWGFATDKLTDYPKTRRAIQVILLVLYSLIVIGVIIATPTRRHWRF